MKTRKQLAAEVAELKQQLAGQTGEPRLQRVDALRRKAAIEGMLDAILAVLLAARYGYTVAATADGRCAAQAAPGWCWHDGRAVSMTVITEHSWAALYKRLESMIYMPEVLHGRSQTAADLASL